MAIVEYKYRKVLEGIATGAIVKLEIAPNNLEDNRVIIETEKSPFKSQGILEGGHENWNKSAKAALGIALENINNSPKQDIIIKKLEGRIFLDTNNASIGVACILALWQYLEIQPTAEVMAKMHNFVKEDWKNDVNRIPDYKVMFNN